MGISVAQGHLFGTILEAALYGVYFVLFFLTAFIYKKWKDNQRSHTIILLAMCCMFCISTAHIGGTIKSLQEAFFESDSPDEYFNDRAKVLNLVNKCLYGANLVIGDALMLYRLYIVSAGSIWFVLPPSLTLMGTAAATYTTIWEFSQLQPGQSAFVHKIKRTAPALFLLSFATNVLITGSIIFKILQVQRRIHELNNNHGPGGQSAGGSEAEQGRGQTANMARFGQPPEVTSAYRRVIANTIESGVIIPTMLLATTILYVKDSNVQDILTGSMGQLTAIVPVLMSLQVRLGFSEYDLAQRKQNKERTTHQSTPLGSLHFTANPQCSSATDYCSTPRAQSMDGELEGKNMEGPAGGA